MDRVRRTAVCNHLPLFSRASLVAQPLKNPLAVQETWVRSLGLIPGLGRYPGEGNNYYYYLLQYSGLEKPMDSPWGRKESDMTEQLSLLFSRKKNKIRLAMWTSAFREQD